MAVIHQLDPIYVDFTQSSAEMLKLRRSFESGKMQGVSSKEVKITLLLEDGTTYAETGRLVFSDISVDENTGSVTLRGQFPNTEKILLPGMFVRGRVEVAVENQAITVPQRGVMRDASGQASVLVVNAQNQVEQRAIRTSSVSGDKWTVSSGLNSGDRVIVEGLQRVRPGSTVVAVPFKANSAGSPPTSVQ
jgi:membrane fusion protein (multidrug efflux system)